MMIRSGRNLYVKTMRIYCLVFVLIYFLLIRFIYPLYLIYVFLFYYFLQHCSFPNSPLLLHLLPFHLTNLPLFFPCSNLVCNSCFLLLFLFAAFSSRHHLLFLLDYLPSIRFYILAYFSLFVICFLLSPPPPDSFIFRSFLPSLSFHLCTKSKFPFFNLLLMNLFSFFLFYLFIWFIYLFSCLFIHYIGYLISYLMN